MNNSFLSPRVVVGAAIVGIVGAAGVYIYEQIYAEKRRSMLVREVARLDKQVASMRSELESIRELQKEANLRRQKHKRVRKEKHVKAHPTGDNIDAVEKSYASDSEYMTDYASVLGELESEMDSEEFYDVPTDEDEDDTLRESLRNGNAAELLEEDLSDKVEEPKTTLKNAT